jgi:hypothetical protein
MSAPDADALVGSSAGKDVNGDKKTDNQPKPLCNERHIKFDAASVAADVALNNEMALQPRGGAPQCNVGPVDAMARTTAPRRRSHQISVRVNPLLHLLLNATLLLYLLQEKR